MRDFVEIGGVKYKHGDAIACKIEDCEVEGQISLSNGDTGGYLPENSAFICQNQMNGNKCEENFGYKYSWFFRILDPSHESVTALRHLTPKEAEFSLY